MKTTICQIARFRRRSAPIRPDPSLFQIVLDRDDRRKVAALCERGISKQQYSANRLTEIKNRNCETAKSRENKKALKIVSISYLFVACIYHFKEQLFQRINFENMVILTNRSVK